MHKYSKKCSHYKILSYILWELGKKMHNGPYKNYIIPISKNFELPTTSMRVVINVILNNFLFVIKIKHFDNHPTSMADVVILIWSLNDSKLELFYSEIEFDSYFAPFLSKESSSNSNCFWKICTCDIISYFQKIICAFTKQNKFKS